MTAVAISRAGGFTGIIQRSMTRAEYFGALYILGCANGIAIRMHKSVAELGWVDALFATFQVSAIVWMACLAGISLMFVDKTDRIERSDIAVGLCFLILLTIPINPVIWTAVTLLSLYVLFATNPPSSRRRGAVILLATAVPMFWSPYLFSFFANIILEVDAALVALLLHSPRIGNMVRFADDSGYLVIFPACSSLANISLAFLCWVTANQYLDHRWSFRDVMLCLLACGVVVAVNITRMAVMGLGPEYYNLLHGLVGETIVNFAVVTATIGICLFGVRREFFARV